MAFKHLMRSLHSFKMTFSHFLFSGNETKLGMSRGIPEPKLTAVDAMIDKLTGAIFIFQIVVVTVLGVAGNVWKDTEARKVFFFLKILCVILNLTVVYLLLNCRS